MPDSRRTVLGAVLGGLVAATSPQAAQAELQAGPGLAPEILKRQAAMRMTPEEIKRRMKSDIGTNLGRLSFAKDGCYETDGEGFTVSIGVKEVIVWDEDAPCAEGQSFIHAVGKSAWSPMTAEAGKKTKHTYVAGTVDDKDLLSQYKDQVGKCFKTPLAATDPITWQIANTKRGGTCNDD